MTKETFYMKKTLKTPMILFFALSLVFALGWAAAFLMFGLTGYGYNFATTYEQWIYPHFNMVTQLYNFQAPLYGWAFGEGTDKFYLTYVAIAVPAIVLIMIILGIVLAIGRKRARYIPYVLVLLVATAAVIEFVANLYNNVNPYVGYFQYITFTPAEEYIANAVYTFVVMGCAALSFIFAILTYFFGLGYAKRIVGQAKDQEVETPEEEAQPEEAQEEPVQDVNELFATTPAAEPVAVEQVEVKPEEYDTMADFQAEPEEQIAQPEEVVVEEVPVNKDAVTKDDLASILKDVVRDIVRDEIARANAAKAEEEHAECNRHGDHSITGATFGGPLIVQYFNGGINGQTGNPGGPAPVVVTPAPAPAPVVVNNPAPKKEEKKPEPAPAPVEAPAEPAQEEGNEKNPIIRIPFTTRMLDADKEMQSNYNELKNEILSYGVNSRVSNSGDTFRLHRKTYVKITIAGKSLKLYFALNPADYADSKMPIGDASQHAVYAETPLIFKVKSGLSVRRAKELIRDVMTPDGLSQGEVESVNWVKELKANAK